MLHAAQNRVAIPSNMDPGSRILFTKMILEITMYEPTIKVRHTARPHDPEARTQVPTSRRRRVTGRSGEHYARESFTLRRMRPWPIAALAIAAVVLTVLGLLYV